MLDQYLVHSTIKDNEVEAVGNWLNFHCFYCINLEIL